MHQAVALYSRAVLAMQDDASLLQGDVQKTFATSAVSIRSISAGTVLSWCACLLSTQALYPQVPPPQATLQTPPQL